MRRRELLACLRLLPMVALHWMPGRARGSEVRPDIDRSILSAVIDALVPADQDPGAVEAGVPDQLYGQLQSNRWHRVIYHRGIELVARLAVERYGTAFAALSVDTRGDLLQSLLDGAHLGGLQFYLRVRSDVFDLFYTSQAGQSMLNYIPPGTGYPDYAGSRD